ncbi:MAG TPA: hypothetical protein VHH90_07280 [Polyangia bacterium]|nr:hypothetical protein [Polyangia bacterium]
MTRALAVLLAVGLPARMRAAVVAVLRGNGGGGIEWQIRRT